MSSGESPSSRTTAGHIQLTQLRQTDVQAFVATIAREVGPGTTRSVYGVLRAALNAAVNTELLARSPARGIKLPQVPKSDVATLQRTDLHLLAAELPDRWQPMIYVAGACALRFSEAARPSALGRALWVAMGANLLQVSRWLGHSTVQITADVYGHLFLRPTTSSSTGSTGRCVPHSPSRRTAADRQRQTVTDRPGTMAGDATIEPDLDLTDVGMRVAGLMAGCPMPEDVRPKLRAGAIAEERVVLRVTPYETFETPPRHVYEADDLNHLTHWASAVVPWR